MPVAYHIERKRIIQFFGPLWMQRRRMNYDSHGHDALYHILSGIVSTGNIDHQCIQLIKSALNTEIKDRGDALTAVSEEFMPKSVMITVAKYIDWE